MIRNRRNIRSNPTLSRQSKKWPSWRSSSFLLQLNKVPHFKYGYMTLKANNYLGSCIKLFNKLSKKCRDWALYVCININFISNLGIWIDTFILWFGNAENWVSQNKLTKRYYWIFPVFFHNESYYCFMKTFSFSWYTVITFNRINSSFHRTVLVLFLFL